MVFSNKDYQLCEEYYAVLEQNCFVAGSEKRFLNQFPFHYKIDVNDTNWARFKDGWSLYKDIRADAGRMGVNLGSGNSQFRLVDNNNYEICATYPGYLIVPRAMKDD